jgi:hypothetical protein
LGFFFIPALAVVEREEGVTDALTMTGLSPFSYVTMRVGAMVAASLLGGGVLVLVATPDYPMTTMLGAGLLSLLFSLLAMTLVGTSPSMTAYFGRIPAVGVLLLLPALIDGSGLADWPALALSPVTGGVRLLFGKFSWPAVTWLVVACAGLAIPATIVALKVMPPAMSTRAGLKRPMRPVTSALISFARVDWRTLRQDRILVLIGLGVPLLAAALRLFQELGLDWLGERVGVDLVEYLPLLWAFVLVVHTPLMFGAMTGVLLLEDRAARVTPAVAVTGASLRSLLTYRLGATAAATLIGVFVGLWIVGAEGDAGWPGIILASVAAAAVSTVPAMLIGVLARDRVQGMAVMKTMSIPFYAPLAIWFGVPTWVLALIPTTWSAEAFWSESVSRASWMTLAAILVSAILVGLLARSYLRRVTM